MEHCGHDQGMRVVTFGDGHQVTECSSCAAGRQARNNDQAAIVAARAAGWKSDGVLCCEAGDRATRFANSL